MKLSDLPRMESDFSSIPAGFPGCPWVAAKDFGLSGMRGWGSFTLLTGDQALCVPVSDFVNMS